MRAIGSKLVCILLGLLLVLPVLAPSAEAQSRLSFIQSLADGQDGVNRLLGALDAVMSPDGRFIYVVAQSDGAVSVFERDVKTGILTFVQALVDGIGVVEGIHGAQGIEMSPDGSTVFTASLNDGSIAAFKRDPVTGRLTFVEAERSTGSVFLTQLEDTAVSPDGRHLYASIFQGGILQHRRNPESGSLDFVRRVDGPLVGATELKFSPDGAFLYVAASADDSVVVYARDPVDGALTLVKSYVNGTEGLDSLDGARGVTLGPAGRTVYVMSTNNDEGTVTVFDRDRVTGLLTFKSVIRAEARTPVGLWGANRMDIDPSGRWAYVVSLFDGQIVVFQRNPATGDLTYFETRGGGTGGVVVSPDERHLYVTSFSSIQAYAINLPETGCIARQDAICLRDRFQARVTWKNNRGGTGVGRVVPGSNDTTGLFWFFKPQNWELQVKVLDGCSLNQHFWVFASAATNVEYTLTVTDTQTGDTQEYFHPLGTPSPAITDTEAFATCP